MFTKAQLVERGSHYFDDPKISKMYATTDGNFFYEQDKTFADSQSKVLKTDVIEITRGDLKEKPKNKAPKEKPEPEVSKKVETDKIEPSENGLDLDALKNEAKKLKIKGWAIMKAETLKRKIDEANGTA